MWQAWHLGHWARSGGALGTRLVADAAALCGAYGTAGRRASLRGTQHLSHTIFDTPSFTPLCHTPSFTHRHRPSFTHHLSHTTLSHVIFDTPSFAHNFVTHRLSPHHLSHTTPSHAIFRHTIFHTPSCHTPFFTHSFATRSLSHTTFTHTPSFTHNFVTHTRTPSFFVTHHLSHTTLSHTTFFYFSILHHLLCLSFLPRPRYNIWCPLLVEVDLWGYPVLSF